MPVEQGQNVKAVKDPIAHDKSRVMTQYIALGDMNRPYIFQFKQNKKIIRAVVAGSFVFSSGISQGGNTAFHGQPMRTAGRPANGRNWDSWDG